MSFTERNKLGGKHWVRICAAWLITQIINPGRRCAWTPCHAGCCSGSWGRDICSAQPRAVGVDDHTFLISILNLSWAEKPAWHPKALPEQKNQPGFSPLWEFWYQELGQSRGGAAERCEVLEQKANPAPSSPDLPKAGRTGICLSCFSSFPAIMIPCLSFQSLIGLETYSHSTGEREKKMKNPVHLPDSSVCFRLLLQASELLC